MEFLNVVCTDLLYPMLDPEEPSEELKPYIEQMRVNIAKTMALDTDRISIKATTEEKLGFTGRKEGISAHCVALITKE